MKRVLSIFFCTLMILSTTVFAFDASAPMENRKPAEYMSKAEFAKSLSSDGMVSVQENDLSSEEKMNMLRDYLFDGFTDEEIASLESVGVYLYSYQTADEFLVEQKVASGGGTTDMVDVVLPAIAYDKVKKTWQVAAGGEWTDISWVPYLGRKIGGYECVGFFFDGTNMGSLSSTERPRLSNVVASLLSVTSDLPRDEREVISTNYNVKSDYGIGSYLQDKSLTGGDYVGEHFAIVCNYDYRFENVTGDLVGYYVHTDVGFELTKVALNVVTSGNSAAVVPLPEFEPKTYEFLQYSDPLELG